MSFLEFIFATKWHYIGCFVLLAFAISLLRVAVDAGVELLTALFGPRSTPIGRDTIKIHVTKRTDDYRATVDGDLARWDCGRTIPESIGNLIMTHPEKFDVEIIEPAN